MYAQLDQRKIEFVDPANATYEIMCKVIKEYSQKQYWTQQQQQQEREVQLSDITFDQAAEVASKNPVAHQYLGDKYRSNESRAARHLRTLFYERQNQDYDGGKITITSKNEHSRMTLRWVRNTNTP